ncbi:MAG: ATPase [Actinobacteria bacterium]|nr:ATPase [Actinomycetota bacterium]
MESTRLWEPRVLIVTGKGGVGKSSVAAALALAAVRRGRGRPGRTCLVEIEGRQTFSRMFDTRPWDFTEREFRPGLFGMSIDPEASLSEYLDLFYGARRLSKLVVGSTMVDFATTAAPGLKDVLLVGKVKEMERRRDPDGRFHYDRIILDAPPTGRIVNFLRAPEATTELVNVGPVRQQAQTVVDMLLDGRRTHLQLVTLLEEMPIAETVDSVHALRSLGVTVGPVVVNRVMPARFDEEGAATLADGLGPTQVAGMVGRGGLALDPAAAAALRETGLRHLRRLALQERMRRELAARVDLPTLELPYVAGDDFGHRELSVLADAILRATDPGR